MSMVNKILLGLVSVLIVMQFFGIDKTNPATDPTKNITKVVDMPAEISDILKTSCYDCHSNEVVYPWYSNIAPFSWIVKDHINEGREEMNFSEWGTFTVKRQDHKLEEIAEEVSEGEMPLTGYVLIHGDARLDKQQTQQLVAWTRTARKALGYSGGEEDEDEDEEHEEEHD